MERGHLWRSCFKLNLRMLEMNSAGITDEMAGKRPAEGVSSPAWIVGHLVYSRRSLITRLIADAALEGRAVSDREQQAAGREQEQGKAEAPHTEGREEEAASPVAR